MTLARRARADQYARRINVAVELLSSGLEEPEVIRHLSRHHKLSERQARRYVKRARLHGTVDVPSEKMVFTVKLPVELVRRLKALARTSGKTLSWLVSLALEEFLGRRLRAGPPGAR